eukprot:2150887-Rhodomonas_salina.3
MLAEEIEQLELAKAQAQKQEEQKERGGVVGSTEEESEKEEQEPPRLPSGDLFTAWLPDSWDSLPWSQGYQDAVKRADQRRAQVDAFADCRISNSGVGRVQKTRLFVSLSLSLLSCSQRMNSLRLPQTGRLGRWGGPTIDRGQRSAGNLGGSDLLGAGLGRESFAGG